MTTWLPFNPRHSIGALPPTRFVFCPTFKRTANGNNTAATAYIEKITPGGVGSVFASSGLNGPDQLAFDEAGNLYVANFNSSTVEEFTPGGVGSQFASVGLTNPNGLAFDISGNLYVANGGGIRTIEEFTPGGVGSDFSTTGLNGTYYMAIEPGYLANVPEPSSFILLGVTLAIGFCGWRLKRRRNVDVTSQ